MQYALRYPLILLAVILAFAFSPESALAEGMPQLDISNPLLIGQIIWGAGIFFVFYLLLSRSALPRVERVLTQRRNRVEGDLKIARHARDEADAAVEELIRARKEASRQAQENIEHVITKARASAEQQSKQLGERLKADLLAAERRIKDARDSALSALKTIAAQTADDLLQTIFSDAQSALPITTNDIRAAIDVHLPPLGH